MCDGLCDVSVVPDELLLCVLLVLCVVVLIRIPCVLFGWCGCGGLFSVFVDYIVCRIGALLCCCL